MSGDAGRDDDQGSLIVDQPGPCAHCAAPAYILRRSGERICAKCYTEEKRKQPTA